jgi:hypothetical protein
MITTIKKPDLQAPRYHPENLIVTTSTFFKRFRRKFPQYKDYTDVQLKSIIDAYNKKIWETVIEHRDGVELPEGTGTIFIGSCKIRNGYVSDMRNSIKAGIRLRHRNFESDGYLAKIFYTNYHIKYKFMHSKLWVFDGCRKFTRAVSETYPDNWKKYIEVSNLRYISKFYNERLKKLNYQERRKDNSTSEDYNEFDID